MMEAQGYCTAAFAAVHEAFQANFATGEELGASACVVHDGQVVVDVWGCCSAPSGQPWQQDTIVNVYSTTKTMAAVCMLMLADRGLIEFDAPVARYWPEFAQNGKAGVLVRHVMSHSAGLAGFDSRVEIEQLYDWDDICDRLARQAPWWEPGTASGGHFGTHQVVTALKLAQLEQHVVHREVILPQLVATGVEGKEVRRRTGWIVRFGPADANDIPAYLAADKKKTQVMRQVRFGWRERLEMAAAWAAPISLVFGLVAALMSWAYLMGVLALVWTTAIVIFLCYDRLPFSARSRKAIMSVSAVGGVQAALLLSGTFTTGAVFGWGIVAAAVVALLTFDFAGSSPTAAAGAFEEKYFQIVLDTDKCAGSLHVLGSLPGGSL